MAAKPNGSATTHVSRHNGHGPSMGHPRFAIPTNRCVKGQPVKGQTAPWFLKRWGSRPVYKLKRLSEAA